MYVFIFSSCNSFLSLGSTFLIPFHPILDTLSFFFYFYLYITTRNYLSHLLLFSSLQEFQQLSISRSFLSFCFSFLSSVYCILQLVLPQQPCNTFEPSLGNIPKLPLLYKQPLFSFIILFFTGITIVLSLETFLFLSLGIMVIKGKRRRSLVIVRESDCWLERIGI